MESHLDVILDNRDGRDILALAGRLDNSTAATLQQKVDALLDTGARRVVVDLAMLEYISSAGLRVLLGTGMRLRGKDDASLTVIRPRGMVKDVLEVAGFGQMFPLLDSLEAALAG